MTSKPKTKPPFKPKEEITMSRFANLRATKKYKFISIEIELTKLSVADVLSIQEMSQAAEASNDEKESIKLMLEVIRKGVPEMSSMTDDEMLEQSMDDLSALSAEIMAFSGLGKS